MPTGSTATASTEPKAQAMQAANKRVLKAIVFPMNTPVIKDTDSGGGSAASKELPEDDVLSALSANGKLIQPPFDLLTLAMLQEHSTEMLPAIEAMEVNIEGFGHKLVSRYALQAPDDDEEEDADDPELKAELMSYTNFFNNCALDSSMVELRRRRRRDMETIGNAYWEVIRSPVNGRIQGFNHIPGYMIRLGREGEGLTKYDKSIIEFDPDGEPSITTLPLAKRFRNFAQIKGGFGNKGLNISSSYKIRWFKEYRDPRVMNFDTGDYCEAGSPEATALKAAGKDASELVHFKIYSPRSAYGIPRYIGNLITIFGDRAAQEINFITLKNNNIPSMAICLSNGQLTEGSITRIQEFVNSQIQGSENYSRFLVLEAEGQLEGEDTGQSKIEIKPLTQQQLRDEMFQNYQQNNAEKLRKCWRLPPIFLGIPGDYNRASADTARRVADEQVFKPERDDFDTWMNGVLIDMGCVYHLYQSKGPNITDDDALTKVLMTAERCGGLSPRIAREIVGEILGRNLPAIDEEDLDPDVPFSIQLAEAAQNKAFMETGSPEVGSQVTAMKHVKKARAMKSLVENLLFHRDIFEQELEKSILMGEPEPAPKPKAKKSDKD